MAQYNIDYKAITRGAAGAITAHRFVKKDATDPRKVVQADASATVFGVATADQADTYSSGDDVPVAIDGIVLVEAGAAVSVDDVVESDASGRAITLVAGGTPAHGERACGRALEAAAAAGELIPVLLFRNRMSYA